MVEMEHKGDDGWYERKQLAMADEQKKDRHPSIECQVAAAKAEELRQRAAKLTGAEEIARRLKAIEEAARKPREAEDGQANGKDLANQLSVLEGEIRAKERKAKEERKQDMAMIDAAGDLADSLTKGMGR